MFVLFLHYLFTGISSRLKGSEHIIVYSVDRNLYGGGQQDSTQHDFPGEVTQLPIVAK